MQEQARQETAGTETSTKTRGRGFLWWGAIVIVSYVIGPGRVILAGRLGPNFAAGLLLAAILCFGVCVLWSRLVQVKEQRPLVPRVIGRILFGIASLIPFTSIGQVAALGPVMIVTNLIMFVIFLVAAYFLFFRHGRTTP